MNIISGNEIFWSAKIFVEAIEMFETAENLKAENFFDPQVFLSIKNFWREKILSKKKVRFNFEAAKILGVYFFEVGRENYFWSDINFQKPKKKIWKWA